MSKNKDFKECPITIKIAGVEPMTKSFTIRIDKNFKEDLVLVGEHIGERDFSKTIRKLVSMRAKLIRNRQAKKEEIKPDTFKRSRSKNQSYPVPQERIVS